MIRIQAARVATLLTITVLASSVVAIVHVRAGDMARAELSELGPSSVRSSIPNAAPPVVDRAVSTVSAHRSAPSEGVEIDSDPILDGPRRRALLIGINDYDYRVGEQAPTPARKGWPRQQWSNLRGAVNDARAVRDMLIARYRFEPQDVELLENGAATREAILQRLDHFLVEAAGPGDTILFYFSGHGSSQESAWREEYDQLDETLVPYDSKLGAADIRDKELRWRFNRILDRGASLTIVLDSCHSGSGARGYPIDGSPKRLEPARAGEGPVNRSGLGPRPDARGALVWSATQDDRSAYETEDESGKPHGAFTLAWLQAIRDAAPEESADYLFRRTRGRLLAEPRYQEAVLGGTPAVRSAPLLGGASSEAAVAVVAVERVGENGRLVLQGGWVHGIGVGSQLRRYGGDPEAPPSHEVTRVLGWGRSEAVLLDRGDALLEEQADLISSGSLVELTNFVALGGQTMKVWMPTHESPESLLVFAQQIADGIRALGWRWVEDPTVESPTHVLRWQGEQWFLIGRDLVQTPLGPSPEVESLLRRLRAAGDGALFVHLPAPQSLVAELGFGPGSELGAVEPVDALGRHHYALSGRLHQGRLEYAWLRAGKSAATSDRAEEASFMPARTSWQVWDPDPTVATRSVSSGFLQQRDALGLARIHAWHTLAAPGQQRFGYELSVRDPISNEPMADRPLEVGRTYGLTLVRRAAATPAEIRRQWYVYVFLIDSEANGVLLYPDPFAGNLENLENRLPRPGPGGAPEEIRLEPSDLFRAVPPHGVDMYFLLASAEPIHDPLGVFEFEGVVRGAPRSDRKALERLLFETNSSTRGAERSTPATWSLDRYPVKVVPANGSPYPAMEASSVDP